MTLSFHNMATVLTAWCTNLIT